MSNAEIPPAQPAGQSTLDVRMTVAASRAYLEQGQINQATHLLDTLEHKFSGECTHPLQFAATCTLGEVAVKQGKLHLAAAHYQFLLDWVDVQPREAELFRFYAGLCALYYEWNQLEKACQYLHWSLTTIEQGNLPQCWAIDSYVRLAWVEWAQGQANAAQRAMQQACFIAQHTADQQIIRQVAAAQAKLWLRQGELAAALYWADSCGLQPDDTVTYQRQFEYVTLARVWIAHGQAAQASPLLQRLRHAATTDGRGGDLVEILALQAVALQAQRDESRAWTVLAQALCRAEREEYIRTFIDEGRPLVDLLQQSAAKGVTLIYIKKLLATFAISPGTPAPLLSPRRLILPQRPQDCVALVEQLTRREQEVLQLVASGKANDEIATLLSISLTTVKKHLSNIFGKLGAKNRTAAVAKARALDLL